MRTFWKAHFFEGCVHCCGWGGESRQMHTPLQKQTWTLKSDIISRVIYLQLTVPPLLEKQRTDVSLVLMKETTNRRWGSIVWGEVLYDDIMHTYCSRIYTCNMNLFFKKWHLLVELSVCCTLWCVKCTRGVKITICGLINKNKYAHRYF